MSTELVYLHTLFNKQVNWFTEIVSRDRDKRWLMGKAYVGNIKHVQSFRFCVINFSILSICVLGEHTMYTLLTLVSRMGYLQFYILSFMLRK